jgi:hypothetical protein
MTARRIVENRKASPTQSRRALFFSAPQGGGPDALPSHTCLLALDSRLLTPDSSLPGSDFLSLDKRDEIGYISRVKRGGMPLAGGKAMLRCRRHLSPPPRLCQVGRGAENWSAREQTKSWPP